MARLVVVIEDEPRIADLVKLLMERAGFDVILAGDGEAGLHAVRNNKPDLVITDMQLPKIHGLAICRAIRNDALLARTRIIAMTAYYRKLQHELEGKDIHVDAYLEKPFGVNDLLSRVHVLFPENEPEEQGTETALEGSDDLVRARNAFRKQAPALLSEIGKVWSRYREDQRNMPLLHQLHQAVRGLTGSAAVHGFAELCRLSSRMEYVVNAIRENKGAIIQTQDEEIRNILIDMQNDGEVNPGAARQPMVQPAMEKDGDIQFSDTVCILSSDDRVVDRISSGLFAFGYDVIRSRNLPGPDLSGIQTVLMDLSGLETDDDRLAYVEQCRLKAGLGSRILAFGHGAVSDHSLLGNLIHTGCWQVLDGHVDGYRVAEMLRDERHGDSEPYRVLILDDKSMGEHFQILLQSAGILTDILDDHERLQLHIREFVPDLVLIGEGLGNLTAVSLIRLVRNLAPDLPVVVACDQEDPDLVQQVRESGGTDVLAMGLSPERLALSLTSRMACSRKQRTCSRLDAASGAFRLPFFLGQLEEELKWADRAGRPLAVAVGGMDDIGELNRKLDTLFVDRMLRAWVDLTRHMGGDHTLVGRVGGNRLGICFPKKTERETRTLLVELQHRFQGMDFLHRTGIVRSSFSLGLITTSGKVPVLNLFQQGRELFYRAQRLGNNRILTGKAQHP